MALGMVPTPLKGWNLRHGGCWMVRMATGGEDTDTAILPDIHGSAASPHAQGTGTTKEMGGCRLPAFWGFLPKPRQATQWGILRLHSALRGSLCRAGVFPKAMAAAGGGDLGAHPLLSGEGD